MTAGASSSSRVLDRVNELLPTKERIAIRPLSTDESRKVQRALVGELAIRGHHTLVAAPCPPLRAPTDAATGSWRLPQANIRHAEDADELAFTMSAESVEGAEVYSPGMAHARCGAYQKRPPEKPSTVGEISCSACLSRVIRTRAGAREP